MIEFARALFKHAETDAEMKQYIDYIIDTPKYVFPFCPKVKKKDRPFAKAHHLRGENAAIQVRNEILTAELRNHLFRLKTDQRAKFKSV